MAASVPAARQWLRGAARRFPIVSAWHGARTHDPARQEVGQLRGWRLAPPLLGVRAFVRCVVAAVVNGGAVGVLATLPVIAYLLVLLTLFLFTGHIAGVLVVLLLGCLVLLLGAAIGAVIGAVTGVYAALAMVIVQWLTTRGAPVSPVVPPRGPTMRIGLVLATATIVGIPSAWQLAARMTGGGYGPPSSGPAGVLVVLGALCVLAGYAMWIAVPWILGWPGARLMHLRANCDPRPVDAE